MMGQFNLVWYSCNQATAQVPSYVKKRCQSKFIEQRNGSMSIEIYRPDFVQDTQVKSLCKFLDNF